MLNKFFILYEQLLNINLNDKILYDNLLYISKEILNTLNSFGTKLSLFSSPNNSGSLNNMPNIEKLFNEELDALMLFAYIVENTFSKAKRLKLIEVVHLLREITNIEMDLRFEAAAANELYENTKNDVGFNVPRIYWNYTTKKILTLDKVDGISIREHEQLEKLGINLKNLAEKLIQHFLKQAVRDGFFHGDMHQGNLFVDEKGNIIDIKIEQPSSFSSQMLFYSKEY